MRDFLREHAWPVVVSVLLHGLLVGGMLLATYISSQTHLPAVQPIPIDAVVVNSQVLHAAQRAQVERAEQEAARARAAAEAKAAQEQAEADARAAAEAEARREHRGIWTGSFREPWTYRACRRAGGRPESCSN